MDGWMVQPLPDSDATDAQLTNRRRTLLLSCFFPPVFGAPPTITRRPPPQQLPPPGAAFECLGTHHEYAPPPHACSNNLNPADPALSYLSSRWKQLNKRPEPQEGPLLPRRGVGYPLSHQEINPACQAPPQSVRPSMGATPYLPARCCPPPASVPRSSRALFLLPSLIIHLLRQWKGRPC